MRLFKSTVKLKNVLFHDEIVDISVFLKHALALFQTVWWIYYCGAILLDIGYLLLTGYVL